MSGPASRAYRPASGAPGPAAPPASPAARAALRPKHQSIVRRLIRTIIGPYMRLYHHLEMQGAENIPVAGPALVALNHASLLDVPALMLLDPFPDTTTVVKSSMFKVPLIGWVLRQWG